MDSKSSMNSLIACIIPGLQGKNSGSLASKAASPLELWAGGERAAGGDRGQSNCTFQSPSTGYNCGVWLHWECNRQRLLRRKKRCSVAVERVGRGDLPAAAGRLQLLL